MTGASRSRSGPHPGGKPPTLSQFWERVKNTLLTLSFRKERVARLAVPGEVSDRLAGPGEGRLRLLALAVLVAVRLVALNADPPPWLSWSTGTWTDEGFYTLDARHEALFGRLAPGDFHDRLLSPLLSLLQQGVFAMFGPCLLAARLLSVTFGLLTVGSFWFGLRRAADTRTADAGALFLALSPPFVFYNRLALQETPTVFWLTLAFALWACGQRKWPLVLSGIAFGVAVIFKPLAFLALPAFVWLWRKSYPAPAIFGAVGTLLLYGLLWYVPHHAELGRMATFYRVHQMQPRSWLSLWLNVRRGFIGGERGVFPYLLEMLPVPVLLAGWGMRRRDTVSVFLTLWLGAALAFCLLSSYAPSRYDVLFLPALAGLAARGVVSLPRRLGLAALTVFLLVSSLWYGQAWTSRTYARRDAAQTLTRLLPPGSVVIGEFAPALCLDTPFAAAPVQPGLSNDDRPIETLHATDVAVTRTPFWEHWWRARYPDVVQPSHRVATFVLGGTRHYIVDVYAVTQERDR